MGWFKFACLGLASLLVGSCGQVRNEGWENRLGDTEVVATLTDPGDPSRVFEVTRGILPAGTPGPDYSQRKDGKVIWRVWTADHPQAYYGLRLKGGDDFLPPSRPYIFPVGGQGFLFGKYAGEHGQEIIATEYIHWDHLAGRLEIPGFYEKGTREDEAVQGKIYCAKLLPRGARIEGGLPKVDSVAMVRPNRVEVFTTGPERKPWEIIPRECVSPNGGESHSRWGTGWRRSTAGFFRLGSTIAYFDTPGLAICDSTFQTRNTVTGAYAQRVYAKHSSKEAVADWVDPWFIIKASDKHRPLFEILQQDGTFQPPPGSLGVIPLEFIFRISGLTDSSWGGGAHEDIYRTMCTGWLVVYGAEDQRRYALASANFQEVTPPIFTGYQWIDSPARRAWIDYQGPMPRYLALTQDGPDRAILLDGSDVPGSLTLAPLAGLVAAAEEAQRARNIEDKLRADKADAALAEYKAQERSKWLRILAEAKTSTDARRVMAASRALGRDAYYEALQSFWASESDLQDALRDEAWSSDQRSVLRGLFERYEEARKRVAAAQEAEANAIFAHNRAIEAAKNYESWAAFRERSAAAAAGNARAVSDTVYNQQMDSYRRGLTDRLPDRR